MPTTATILFTALPNGILQVDGREALALSVFVSPRLERTEPPQEGEGTVPLGDYPDIAAWPDVVSTMRWTVQFSPPGGGDADINVPAQPVPDQVLDSELWRAIFPSDTGVPRYRFEAELATLPVVSYPAGDLAIHIQNLYREVGARYPRDLPPVGGRRVRAGLLAAEMLAPVAKIATLLRIPDPPRPGGTPVIPVGPELTPQEVVALGRSEEARLARRDRIAAVREREGAIATDYLLLRAFHHRVPAAAPYLPPPQLDFHRIVSALGNYPSLLRRLGLVVDLVVPLPSPMPVVPALVRVIAEWAPRGAVEPRTPRTLMGPDFRPLASPDADIASGYLRLDSAWPTVQDGRFQLCQLDVDGAGLKLLSLVETLESKANAIGLRDRLDRDSLPSLSSAGLGVLRRARGEQVEKNVDRSMDLQNKLGATDELRAEDVLRGARVDVFDETTGEWRSLHAQQGVHVIGDRRITQPPEEGFVEPGATRPLAPKGTAGAPEGAPADAIEVHEKIFSWEGWSLSVAPEGKAHPQKKRPLPQGVEPPKSPRPIVKSQLKVVPGTLPRLRFGRSYRFRARTVDLAGNSIRRQEAGEEHASPPERYLRLEPVVAPTVIPVLRAQNAYPPGESLELLAVRSDRTGHSLDLRGEGRPTRLFVPPPIGQRTAEMHGVFDHELDEAREHARQGRRAQAEKILEKVHRFIVNHDNNLPEWIARSAASRPRSGLSLYLPDPLSFGVALRALPGEAAWIQSFYSKGERTTARREEPLPIRLTLDRSGLTEPAGAQWSPDRRELVVRLRPSQVLRIDCSSYLCPEDIELLQIWHWMKDASPDIERARLDAIRGDFWMLTPKREIVLVHAVKQPLLPPLLENVDGQTTSRRCGETALTFVDLVCKKPVVSVHQASTSRVDVMAEYREPVDDPSSPDGTRWLKGSARAFDIIVQAPAQIGIAGETSVPRIALSLAEKGFDGKPVYRHELGDTKYRHVRYHAVATTRFREYFEPVRATELPGEPPSPVEREFTLAGEAVTVDVLSTARPIGAKVVYGIPTFAWCRGGGVLSTATKPEEPSPEVRRLLGFSSLVSPGDVRWSERKGNGLRIYIEGPWWSSGEGETLGVLLVPEGRRDLGRYLPYVSTWGTDPVWKYPGRYPSPQATLPAEVPGLRHFPAAIACHEGVQLAELGVCGRPGGGPLPVAVAGHAVAWDPARKLWYCDVEMDVGTAYFPFIRLALARFQPRSVEGVHLSGVTLMDFIQVTPDRILTVTSRELETKPQERGASACATPWARTELDITLLGSVPENRPNQVRIDVQEQRTPGEGDFGWVTLGAPDIDVRVETPPGTLARAVVRLPAERRGPARRRYRLLVQEFEHHITDGDHGSTPVATSGLRPVYAETVELEPRTQ
ncbi:hypothetical protein [Sorangium sp. So ce128]|uniref:hypothetical protein n=1 Tax=Sorangium sp. So ce128 TaxID=3133281 RepID=UPI003F624ACF